MLMIGAAGVGKTAAFLYPNLEYSLASGMSFLVVDTKGDLYRNYEGIAKEHYNYNVSVIDLRSATFSEGNNMLHLVNKYMDLYKKNPKKIQLRSKSERYAKIIAKTIISSGSEGNSKGTNQYFYDSAEGLVTAIIMVLAEYIEPVKIEGKTVVKGI